MEGAKAVDLYFYVVAGLNWAYSGGGSGGDEIAGFEGHGGGDISE